jgi:hypothetical protein
MRYFFIIFCLLSSSVYALFVGNPANPALFTRSVFFSNNETTTNYMHPDENSSSKSIWSIRGGIFYDRVYSEHLTVASPKTELDVLEENQIKLSTFNGLVAFNFYNRVDIYGFGGIAKLYDDVLFAHSKPCGGVGASIFIYQWNNWFLGIDGKYFLTKQESDSIRNGRDILTFVNEYHYSYQEGQVSLGLSYKMKGFIPYLAATYLKVTSKPEKNVWQARYEDSTQVEFEVPETTNKCNWGLIAGCSIFAGNQMSLSLETRFFDQYSYHLSGTFRF